MVEPSLASPLRTSSPDWETIVEGRGASIILTSCTVIGFCHVNRKLASAKWNYSWIPVYVATT